LLITIHPQISKVIHTIIHRFIHRKIVKEVKALDKLSTFQQCKLLLL
jgi:hypothetical protein